MKKVTLRSVPTHWLGMTIGAATGGTLAVVAGAEYIKSVFARSHEAIPTWAAFAMTGSAIGALIGLAMARLVYRQRDHSVSEEKLFEREVQLHHEYAQGTLLFAYAKAFPESTNEKLGETILLTSHFLIQAVMEVDQCRAVCKRVGDRGHFDSSELFATLVLPNAKSIRAIPLSGIRSVFVKEDVLKVTSFDEERRRDYSSWWAMPEESDKCAPFIWKLKEALGCRHPISRRKISERKKRIRLWIATLGVVICWPLFVACLIASHSNPWLIVPMILSLVAAAVFTSSALWIWRDQGELVVFERGRSLKESQTPKHFQVPPASYRHVGIDMPRTTDAANTKHAK